MTVKVYKNAAWHKLGGEKIRKDGQWHTVKDSDRLYFQGNWHPVGSPECAVYGYRRSVSSDPFSEFLLDGEASMAYWPPGYYDLDGVLGKYTVSNDPFDFVFTAFDFSGNSGFFPVITVGYGTTSHFWAIKNGALYKALKDSLGNLQENPAQYGTGNQWTSLNALGYGTCNGQLYQVRYDGTTVLLDDGNSGWTRLFDEYFMVNNLTDNPGWTGNTYVIYGVKNDRLYQVKEIGGPDGTISVELISSLSGFTHAVGYHHDSLGSYDGSYDNTRRRFGIAGGRMYLLEPTGETRIGVKTDWVKITGAYSENGNPEYSDEIGYPLAIDENTGLYIVSPTGETLIDSGDYQDVDGIFRANSSYYGSAVKNGELFHFNHADGYYPANLPAFTKISGFSDFIRTSMSSSSSWILALRQLS